MVSIDTSSRRMFEGMFAGEAVKLPPELELLFTTFLMGVEEVKDSARDLSSKFSAEMGGYLQTLLDAIANMGEAAQEKQAAGMLTERFGVPKFNLAVPVYNLLVKNLLNSERVAELSLREANDSLRFFKGFLYRMAVLIFDEEIQKLQKEADAEAVAMNEFSSEVEVESRTGVKVVVTEAKGGFKEKYLALKVKIDGLKQKRAHWFEMLSNLFQNQRETEVKVGQRYEIDLAMAL